MIAAPRSFSRVRGFSVRELTLTLLLLAVVIVIALRLIDLRTRLLAVEKDDPGLGGVLDVAVRSLSRDLDAAGRGGVALEEAVRPVADNTGAEGALRTRDAAGETVVIRTGTDQLGLRGVIRSALLVLGTSREPDGTNVADRIRRDASSVLLRAGVPRSDPDHAQKLQSVIERLSGPARRSKRFFLAADSSGRYAIARVRTWNPSPDQGLEFLLDFADPEAASLNARGEADAARSLGEPVTGGLLDDLVWFVARGPEGRPPDYAAASDPPSMKFPHPYLAVAAFAGEGRWEITRVAEDVEDLQVAWGLAGTGDALVWRGDVAGSRAPTAADLADSGGRPLLRALKVALAAKAERRYARGDGPPPSTEFLPLLNAPAPVPGPARGDGPVGWDPDESRRIPFERQSREVVLAPRGEKSPAPR